MLLVFESSLRSGHCQPSKLPSCALLGQLQSQNITKSFSKPLLQVLVSNRSGQFTACSNLKNSFCYLPCQFQSSSNFLNPTYLVQIRPCRYLRSWGQFFLTSSKQGSLQLNYLLNPSFVFLVYPSHLLRSTFWSRYLHKPCVKYLTQAKNLWGISKKYKRIVFTTPEISLECQEFRSSLADSDF